MLIYNVKNIQGKNSALIKSHNSEKKTLKFADVTIQIK